MSDVATASADADAEHDSLVGGPGKASLRAVLGRALHWRPTIRWPVAGSNVPPPSLGHLALPTSEPSERSAVPAHTTNRPAAQPPQPPRLEIVVESSGAADDARQQYNGARQAAASTSARCPSEATQPDAPLLVGPPTPATPALSPPPSAVTSSGSAFRATDLAARVTRMFGYRLGLSAGNPPADLATDATAAASAPPGSLKSSRGNGNSDGLLSYPSGTAAEAALAAGQMVCLVCLDTLTQADFNSGEAIRLECQCKGEMALRHRSCALKWSQVKGSNVCDVCKAPIANLPPVPPRVESAAAAAAAVAPAASDVSDDSFDVLRLPDQQQRADYVFDCIRITWVTMIVCILFLEFSVARSFSTGALLGIAYAGLSRSLRNSSSGRSSVGGGGGGQRIRGSDDESMAIILV